MHNGTRGSPLPGWASVLLRPSEPVLRRLCSRLCSRLRGLHLHLCVPSAKAQRGQHELDGSLSHVLPAQQHQPCRKRVRNTRFRPQSRVTGPGLRLGRAGLGAQLPSHPGLTDATGRPRRWAVTQPHPTGQALYNSPSHYFTPAPGLAPQHRPSKNLPQLVSVPRRGDKDPPPPGGC